MKNLLKYLRFNLNTLQGKITVGLWTVGLMGVMITLFPMQTYREIQKRQDFVLRQVVQVMYHGSKLENNIGETSSAVQDFILTKDLSFTNKCRQIWKNQCQAGMDSLLASARSSQDPATEALVNDLSVRLQRLRTEQEIILNFYEKQPSDSLIKIYQNDYLNRLRYHTEDLKTVLETIMNIQESTILRMNVQNEIDKNTSLSVFIAMALAILIASALVGYAMVMTEVLKIKKIKNALQDLQNGILPNPIPQQKDEYHSTRDAINAITENFKTIIFFTQNFETIIEQQQNLFENKGQLEKALNAMQERLRKQIEDEKQRRWETQGIDNFNKLLRDGRNTGKNVDQICDVFLSEIVDYLKVQQGNIYVVRSSDKEMLRLSAFYAFGKRKERNLCVPKGEGLVGEVFRENQSQYIDIIPEDYIKISSGLGSTKPNYLLIVPLRANDEVQGVIELAAIKPFPAFHVDFVEKAGESIASTLVSIRNLERNKRLLREAQQATEQLRSQEEEMRQNLEEFQATQETMERREKENKLLMENLQQREKVAQAIAQENTLLKAKIQELEKKIK